MFLAMPKSLLRKWVGLFYWCGFRLANDSRSQVEKKWLILEDLLRISAILFLTPRPFMHIALLKNTYKQLPSGSWYTASKMFRLSWRFLSVLSKKIIILKAELIHQNLIEGARVFVPNHIYMKTFFQAFDSYHILKIILRNDSHMCRVSAKKILSSMIIKSLGDDA